MTDYAEANLAPSTLAHYRQTVRKVLVPALGSLEIGDIRPSHIQALYGRLLREGRLAVGHVRWHDLRHVHATLMLASGVHPKVVGERLGHASVGITLDTCSRVLPGL